MKKKERKKMLTAVIFARNEGGIGVEPCADVLASAVSVLLREGAIRLGKGDLETGS